MTAAWRDYHALRQMMLDAGVRDPEQFMIEPTKPMVMIYLAQIRVGLD